MPGLISTGTRLDVLVVAAVTHTSPAPLSVASPELSIVNFSASDDDHENCAP
jgi:hypothetical protein